MHLGVPGWVGCILGSPIGITAGRSLAGAGDGMPAQSCELSMVPVGGESNASRRRSLQVAWRMFGCRHVASAWCLKVGAEKFVGDADVWTGPDMDPGESPHWQLMLGYKFPRWRLAICRDAVNYKSGPAGRWGRVAVYEPVSLQQFGYEPFLRQVSQHALGRCCPFKGGTKKLGDRTHEIHLDAFHRSGFEPLLDVFIGGKSHKIVHTAAHVDGGGGKVRMDAGKDAGVMDALREPHV
jgi:hypothetical protein